jgi:hypothetical protein
MNQFTEAARLEPTLSPAQTLAQLQEALVMAGMVSLRNDLSVEIGIWWTFNWLTNVISLPMEELVSCPQARIRWIILHEAAHAAVTRLHDILPAVWRNRPEVDLLLNVIEDIRIEKWLVARYPRSAPWQKVARQYEEADLEPPDPEDHPVRAFLKGIFDLGRNARLPQGTNPVALSALVEVRSALEQAFECVPPATELCGSVDELYERHPVSHAYRTQDSNRAASSLEKWVRIMQASMWRHVLEGVLPVYMRLVKEFGAVLPPPSQQVRVVRPGHGRPSDRRNQDELTRALRARLASGGNGPYLQAVHQYADAIRAVTEVLLRLLPNHRGLRYIRRCRNGDRLDLRIAAQLEADRRLHAQLWMQRRRRTLPDPAFVFVVDRSYSMKEAHKSQAAFESMVLMREACTRVGIPFSIVAFNDRPDVLDNWDPSSDAQAEAVLSSLLDPEGRTDIERALHVAADQLRKRPERERILVLLTDGMVSDGEKPLIRRQVAELEKQNVRVMAIAIGRETEGIRELFPRASIIRAASALPAALSASLVEVLGGMGLPA